MADKPIVDTGNASSPHKEKDSHVVKLIAESCYIVTMIAHDVETWPWLAPATS